MADGLLALALGAGMLAAVNPCGFALLPAYLSLLIVGDDEPTRATAVARALRLTLAMTLGFAAVFGAFGLVVAPVASGVQRYLPWFTVGFGVVLAGLGGWLLAGRSLYLPKWGSGSGAGKSITGSFTSMVGFGASYALASLTCTIAPFLAIVIAGTRAQSVVTGIAAFAAYAAGMALVVGVVAIATALAKGALVKRIRRTGRWVSRLSGALLLLAGLYVAYYGQWELRVLNGGEVSDPIIEAAEAAQRWVARVVAAPGPWGWLAILGVLLALVLVRSKVGSRRRASAN